MIISISDLFRLKKQREERVSRLVALDVGQKRIGVAVSSSLWINARPVSIVKVQPLLCEKLVRILTDNCAAALIVGYPLHHDGREGRACEMVMAFLKRFASYHSLPTLLWNEHRSSKAALLKRGVSKTLLDDRAAAVFLEEVITSLG